MCVIYYNYKVQSASLLPIINDYTSGSSAPAQPIDTVHTTLSSELAVIQWLVPVVAYTPETYTVSYGTDPTMLNYTSEVIVGSTDVTAINQVHLVTLRNLQSNTRYYYRVVATNTIGTNSSVIRELLTPQPGNILQV